MESKHDRREGFIEQVYERGFRYEREYHGCAQCVVAAVQDAFGLREDTLLKAMTGFGGGGGGCCDGNCGAYAGGIALLGWLAGRPRESFFTDHDTSRSYALVRRLHERFIAEYGAVICRDICRKLYGRPFYTADPDDYRKFQDAGAYGDGGCTRVVGNACRWVAELILDEELATLPAG